MVLLCFNTCLVNIHFQNNDYKNFLVVQLLQQKHEMKQQQKTKQDTVHWYSDSHSRVSKLGNNLPASRLLYSVLFSPLVIIVIADVVHRSLQTLPRISSAFLGDLHKVSLNEFLQAGNEKTFMDYHGLLKPGLLHHLRSGLTGSSWMNKREWLQTNLLILHLHSSS